MTVKNIEIQDSDGVIYHPHTDANVVKYDNTTVAERLDDIANKNLIINGEPLIWQRGTSLVNVQNFCADRWEYICWHGSSPSGKIEKDVDGSMKISQLNPDGNYIKQIIESSTSRELANKKVTLSADIKSNNSTTGSAFIQLVFSNGVDILNETSSHKELIISHTNLTSEYQRFIFTVDVPATTNTVAVQIGSHYSNGGSLNSNCILNVKNIKLEIGEKATPFVPRLYGEELALCQRYFQRFSLQGTTYGSGDTATNNISFNCSFPCSMRIPPTIEIVDKFFDLRDFNAVTVNYSSSNDTTHSISNMLITENSLKAGRVYNAELKLDSEIR